MRCHVGPFITIAITGVLVLPPTGPLTAQTPVERASVDAFRDTLGALADQTLAAQFVARERAARPATGDKEIQRLRLGWALMRYGQLTDSAPPMIEALLQFYEASVRRGRWPYAWFGLGATKLALDLIGASEVRSAHQSAGSGWRWGAANAFLSAVQADTGYVTAAVELGLTVMRTPNWVDFQPVVAAMSRAARSGRLGDEVWLVLGRLERQIDSNTAALHAFDTYAALAGADRGLAQLERARTLFALGQGQEGERAYFAGAADPSREARALYRKDAAWIADSAELATIDSASGDSLPVVLGRLWRGREATSGRAAGSRLVEHYRRWGVAQHRYRQIYTHDRQWEFGQVFRSAQDDLDDRGVIYMRHGEPDDRASFAGDEGIPPNESWVYHRPRGDLVLHFSASSGSSGWHLIDGLGPLDINPCLVPGLLDSRAPLDPSYQFMADRARNDSIRLRMAEKRGDRAAAAFFATCTHWGAANARNQRVFAIVGLSQSTVFPQYFGTHVPNEERLAATRMITVATHTDSDPLRYRAQFNPRLQVYGVGGREPGAGQLLVVWAIPGEDRPRADTIPGVAGVVYSTRIRVNVTDSSGRLVMGIDSIKRQRANSLLPNGALVNGLLILEVPSGTYRAQISIADTLDAKGAARVIGGVPVPAFTGPMEMSDLVLGLEGQALAWDRGGVRFPLNPRNAWTTAEAVEIGFELGGLAPGNPYKVRLGITDIGADSTTPPKASVEFENKASGGREFVSQSLGLRTLRPGRYLLTATVTIGDRVLRREKRITISRP